MARKPSTARARAPRASKSVAPARMGRKPSAPRTAGASEDAPYHHGALRDALLEAAERVLERDGLSGLTLRAVAREAGVSHAAPTHHFGDLTGLVSELAAIGFRQFNAAMTAANAAGTLPVEKAMAPAKAYVALSKFTKRRCRSNRPRPSHAPGRWCTASPCCCSITGSPTFFAGSRKAPTPKPCWTPCSNRPSAGRRGRDQRRVANSTARPLAPITLTSFFPHWKPRAVSSAALRASSLASGLAFTSI